MFPEVLAGERLLQDQAISGVATMAHSGNRRFVICICNDDHPASLERRKIYEALPDADAAKHQQARMIDESGEDYPYPKEYLIPVRLPKTVDQVLVSAA